ncbi:hypothetical protein CRYUN_Cryun19dG0166600 [Craigia yunnanensis]
MKFGFKTAPKNVQRAKCIIINEDDVAVLPAKSQGGFPRMFLGLINMRPSRKDIQLEVKENITAIELAYLSIQNDVEAKKFAAVIGGITIKDEF